MAGIFMVGGHALQVRIGRFAAFSSVLSLVCGKSKEIKSG